MTPEKCVCGHRKIESADTMVVACITMEWILGRNGVLSPIEILEKSMDISEKEKKQ